MVAFRRMGPKTLDTEEVRGPSIEGMKLRMGKRRVKEEEPHEGKKTMA